MVSNRIIDYQHHTFVFFDGHCPMCHGFARFFLYRLRRPDCWFAPLAGKTMADLIATGIPFPQDVFQTEQSTLVVIASGRPLMRSEAILTLMQWLPMPWRGLASLLQTLPPRGLDWIYDSMAQRRYRWFGRYPSCPLPPPSLAWRFLP